jgi:hypothetical protein
VQLSDKELVPQDRKDDEEEAEQEQHFPQIFKGLRQRVDERPHPLDAFHRPQGPEHAHSPQKLDGTKLLGFPDILHQNTDHARNDHNKVEPVPHISQVGMLVQDKAPCNDFDHALDGEKHSEDQLGLRQYHLCLGPMCAISHQQILSVHLLLCALSLLGAFAHGIFEDEEDAVQGDQKQHSIVEEVPLR